MSGSPVVLWLALSAVLTTATQLRPGELPIGVGEVLLALWMVYASIHAIWSRDQVFTRDGFAVCAASFWIVCACLLSLGGLLSMASSFTADTGAMHDSAALTFCALMTMVVPLATRRSVQSLATALVAIIGVVMVIQLIAAFSIRRVGPIDLWFSFIRFRGWSHNPNQMALLVVGVPFLALQLASEAASKLRKVGWLCAGAVAIVAGIITLSDALALAWGLCAALWLLLLWVRALSARRELTWGTLLWGILLPLTIACALIPMFSWLIRESQEVASSIYGHNRQGSVRLAIWGYALESVMQSPLFGWGPGAHAGKTGAHQGFEAHNTFIDWASSAGLPGLMAYLMLLGSAAMQALKSRNLPLCFGLAALASFSTFHFVLRHPMFWMYLLIIYEYSRQLVVDREHAERVAIPCAA